MLRAVIFDYGNTLIGIDPSTPSARTDYADVVARPGAERLAAHLARHGSLPDPKRMERFIERFLEIRERNRLTAERTGREITALESLDEALADAPADAESASLPTAALEDALRVYFSAEEERIVALEGAVETLEFLRERGLKIGLLSNATDGRYVERVATRLGMRSYFDPFLVSADLGIRKPRAEAFRAVLERWALPAATAAMVGDSLHHDVGGANRLGLYSVHYAQISNPFDTEHRGVVVPSAEARSHGALRALLGPLVAPGP